MLSHTSFLHAAHNYIISTGDLQQKLQFFKTSGKICHFNVKFSDSDADCHVVVVVNDREKTEVCFSSKGLGTRTRTEAKECAMWQAVDFLSNQKFLPPKWYLPLSCQWIMPAKDKPLPKYTEARRVSASFW